MDSVLGWYRTFRFQQHITDIRANHKRRAALYDLLENYCQSIPSLVDVLQRIAARKEEDGDNEYKVFESILHAIEKDNMSPLAAMSMLFPRDEVALIESASTKGQVHKGFARARFIAEKRAEAKGATKMALAYPAYIIISTLALFYFILDKTVPEMERFIPASRWPEWTQFLHTMYLVLVEYNYLVAAWLVTIILFTVFTLKFKKGAIRNFLDYLPPWSIQKRIQSSVFLIALGDLVNNGDSFPRAIRRLQEYSPNYLGSYLEVMIDRLEKNETVPQSLDCGLFSKTTTGYIKDFSHLKAFGPKVIQIGEKALDETVGFIKLLAVSIGLVGVIFAAGANGYIALSQNAIQKTFITEITR